MRGTLPRKQQTQQQQQQAQHQPAKGLFTRFVTARYQTLNANGGQLGRQFAGIRTTVGAPRFPLQYMLSGVSVALQPPSSLFLGLKNGGSWDAYEAGYRAHLDRVGVESIETELSFFQAREGNPPLALLCFCDLSDGKEQCHRRIFASWWQEKTGEVVPELKG